MSTPTRRSLPTLLARAPAAIAAALLALVATLSAGAPASAGGWAVGTLDEVGTVTSGETISVGFTIRQHGVTPVTLDDAPGAPVGIEIVDSSGRTLRFPAAPDGPVGHHVAAVTLPDEAGEVAWTLQMGMFGPQPLGDLSVGAPPATGGSLWSSMRWIAVSLTACLVALALADVVVDRRRAGRHGVTTVEPA